MPLDRPKKPDLSRILTPDLYSKVLKLNFPWDGHVDIRFAAKFFFIGEPNISQQCFDAFHFRATKPISFICPEIPDVRKYLPDPNDPQYPEHVLALIIVLDQMPRRMYRGVDMRYTNMFFDATCLKLTKELVAADALPESTDDWQRLGFSFDDAVLRKNELYVSLVHSEDLSDHDFMVGRTEAMRKEVERHYGVRDPARDTMDKDAHDPLLFARLIKDGPPLNGSAPDFFFYFFRVVDAHRPVIKKFGRFPYRNEVMGRETTAREKEFLKATENFGSAGLSEAEVERLRKQVKDGIWDELSDRGPR
ncbi:hypothetical protein V5O48_005000 [Marasmius crinis-equi]|uniref:Uncharacterized protein n=1 Tax=Marasmius crinis-equi TaxID=585013 RepID=A0ABR3FNI0_9AGAR